MADQELAHGDTLPISGSAPTIPPAGDLPVGARVGRYVVLRKLGAGGMGVVYMAYDEGLDRRIALKLITGWDGDSGKEAGQRLLREAQAMAKLSHPNVVTVFDVGTFADQVFLAMEYVDGLSLRAWLRNERTAREILAVFLQAGRGLEAAHEAGIFHRDFKPDNVVLDARGTAHVLDFGLARIDRVVSQLDEKELAATGIPSGPLSSTKAPLTNVGALLGTPGYMAPEQLTGGAIDARTDQFAFGVALYEALYGERPFDAATLRMLLAEMQENRVRPAPKGAKVPQGVRAVLLRALRAKPDERFGSMREVIGALEDDRAARMRKIAIACATVALVTFGAAGAARPLRPAVCAGADREIAGTWGSAQAAEVDKGFAASGNAHAAETAGRVRKALDAYAASWAKMSTESCQATRVRGVQSDEALDLRTACLEARRNELGATVALLEKADAKLVDDAVPMTRALADLDRCADIASLRTPYAEPRDPAARAAVDALRKQLASATALVNARKLAEAADPLAAIVAGAKQVGNRPLEADALFLQAKTEQGRGDDREAAKAAHDSALEAAAVRYDVAEAKAWTLLVAISGYDLGHVDEGDLYADLAANAIGRAGNEEALQAQLLYNRGRLMRSRGQAVPAEQLFRDARERFAHVYGAQSLEVADADRNLGDVLADQWRLKEQRAAYEDALDSEIAIVGEPSSRVALTLAKIALAEETLGDADATVATARRAHPAASPDDVYHSSAQRMLAEGLAYQGDLDGAERALRVALAELAHHYGEGTWQTGGSLSLFAGALTRRHFTEAALRHFDEAIAILVRGTAGRGALLTARAYHALCAARLRRAGATAEADLAVAAWEKESGPKSPDQLVPLLSAGEAALASSAAERALPPLERAFTIAETTEGVPEIRADIHFALARALVAMHADRPRAKDLAQRAAREYDATHLPDLARAARAL